MRQGDVGDGGVQHLHEGGERDRKRDGPGVVFWLPVEGVGHLQLLVYGMEFCGKW